MIVFLVNLPRIRTGTKRSIQARFKVICCFLVIWAAIVLPESTDLRLGTVSALREPLKVVDGEYEPV